MSNISFQCIDWSKIEQTQYAGETGKSSWQTIQYDGLRCHKGHIVHCLEEALISEMVSGQRFILLKGMSYFVSDDLSSHHSCTMEAAKLLIIDGDFLSSGR